MHGRSRSTAHGAGIRSERRPSPSWADTGYASRLDGDGCRTGAPFRSRAETQSRSSCRTSDHLVERSGFEPPKAPNPSITTGRKQVQSSSRAYKNTPLPLASTHRFYPAVPFALTVPAPSLGEPPLTDGSGADERNRTSTGSLPAAPQAAAATVTPRPRNRVMVPATGVEPARAFAHCHLKTARLPNPPRRHHHPTSMLVRSVGLEPTLPFGNSHLKAARLPVPPRPHS